MGQSSSTASVDNFVDNRTAPRRRVNIGAARLRLLQN
jgi:hypothetical protein